MYKVMQYPVYAQGSHELTIYFFYSDTDFASHCVSVSVFFDDQMTLNLNPDLNAMMLMT